MVHKGGIGSLLVVDQNLIPDMSGQDKVEETALPPKTITEFCCEVDASGGDPAKLRELARYILEYGRRYSLLHLEYMVEHIENARINYGNPGKR